MGAHVTELHTNRHRAVAVWPAGAVLLATVWLTGANDSGTSAAVKLIRFQVFAAA